MSKRKFEIQFGYFETNVERRVNTILKAMTEEDPLSELYNLEPMTLSRKDIFLDLLCKEKKIKNKKTLLKKNFMFYYQNQSGDVYQLEDVKSCGYSFCKKEDVDKIIVINVV